MTSVRKMVLVPVEKYKSLQSNNCQNTENSIPPQTDVTPPLKQTEASPPASTPVEPAPVVPVVQSPVQPPLQSEPKEYYVQVPRKVRRKPVLKWITL